ncbi:hypothetical protein HPP92_006542 [Vanilla planifolia]|uniref:Uncharacterized protein n=1 Tax=Vanilla planifolia TaxID=51239 RepID=A0A835RKJ0_VANPL|nr:hypothetical protein HPP92_006542 [Vanilla planifolia]
MMACARLERWEEVRSELRIEGDERLMRKFRETNEEIHRDPSRPLGPTIDRAWNVEGRDVGTIEVVIDKEKLRLISFWV